MQDQDKPAFEEIMMAFGEIHKREITKPLMRMYFLALSKESIEQVQGAAVEHMRNPDSGQFFPKPADLIRNSKQLLALKATEERSSSAFSCEVSMSAVEMRAKVKSGDYTMGPAYMAALELEVAIAEGRGVKINGRRR
ncbi:MAG: hypothetical protein ACRDC6_32050 [Shewanella sp.]